jgi:protein-S-isoprenylcysteine O-methyltransferase Ste14
MKLLTNWGFSPESWKGQRGEYWVLIQVGLMFGYLLLPIYRPPALLSLPTSIFWLCWATAALLFGLAAILLIKALIDLGQNLTPLPHPKDDSQLIQTGTYSVVRHPLYSGITLAALAYAVGQFSLLHLAATLLLLIFFNFKASREEAWLSQKHPDYASYQQRVKKLIPWVF